MWKAVSLVISTAGAIPKCLHECIKPLELASVLFILMQKDVIAKIIRPLLN